MSVLPKNKKVTVGIGIATAAAAAIALGGGTYAAFSDTEDGPTSTLAAGTLDLTVGANPAEAQKFEAKDIAPGYTSAPYKVTFKNAGTVPGNLAVALKVVNAENGCNAPEAKVDNTCDGAAGELGSKMNVTISGPGGTVTAPVGSIPANLPGGQLGANAEATYTISYSLPPGVGNEVQSDGVTITSTATLNQA
jgi:predicted ribosomally synthesized peptide with SipW-like signal peptide